MSRLEELNADLDDLKALLDKCQRTRSRELMSIEIRKLETEILIKREQLNEAAKASADIGPGNDQPTVTNARQPGCYDVKLTNYGWDQSDKFVKLYIDLPNVQTLAAENIVSHFNDKSMSLSVAALDNKNYTLTITNLLNAIVPAESHTKTKTDRLVVFLKKKSSSHWSNISSLETKPKDPKPPKLNDNADPSSGLMDLMKQMYEDGDDEMKRTIAKAWTESREKGTAMPPIM